ncbi:hypothetical protein [Ralstonia pseudosolanacearum]|uniref:hypothetical protein n=1 Tax=Ralstonia pseudosolanacearum TaxID=1310165 RepID=UPI002675F484|nr:hypothetical protein [Ralstonia pseudosolanacearum]MDO3546624.1 hypothetical protein [Ralstonia pseudosolanacearum]MDO3596074.1 hypothetical protein [Ralstonia pseudosolanacearum]
MPLEQQRIGHLRIADGDALQRLAEADLALAAAQQMQRLVGRHALRVRRRRQGGTAQRERAHPTANDGGFSHVAPLVCPHG